MGLVCLWAPFLERGRETREVPKTSDINDKGVGMQAIQGQAEEQGMFSLEKSRLRKDMIAAFKSLKSFHKVERKHLLSLTTEGKKYGNGLKVQQISFRINLSKNFLIVRTVGKAI